MAIRTLRFLGFPRALRYRISALSSFSNPVCSYRLCTSGIHEKPPNPSQTQHQYKPVVSERFVLEELSDLLHIESRGVDAHDSLVKSVEEPRNLYVAEAKGAALLDVSAKTVEEPHEVCVADGLISPVEKLRGVFLQKLRGKSAVESALSATGVELTAEVFAGVVNRGNLGGAVMVSFFDWAVKQPTLPHCLETYNVIIKALGRRRFFSYMEEILFRMKRDGVNPDSKTVLIALDCYVAARLVHKAVEMFERLEEIGAARDSDSLRSLLYSLCRWSHMKLASSYFNKMKGEIPIDVAVYNEIIGGWAKLGMIEQVEGYWKALIADGLIPDSYTFGHLIRALGKAGRIDDAVDTFKNMGEKGCVPDTITYNALIGIFVLVGDLDRGIESYKNMVVQNCLPDNETYSKLIGALLKFRRVADALEIFDEMLNRGVHPATGMITSFIEPLCSYGPPHAAMMIYKKTKKVGCRLSLKAYKLLLMRLSKFGKCGTVLQIWEEMQEDGYSSDVETYEYIIEGLCNTGQLDSAVLVVEESLQNGFCIGGVVYSKLSNRLLEANKVETAYNLLHKVRESRRSANMQRNWRFNGWHY